MFKENAIKNGLKAASLTEDFKHFVDAFSVFELIIADVVSFKVAAV